MFRSDNPINDSIVYINYMDGINSEVITEECEVCLNRSEDFRLGPASPFGKIYVCVDCLHSGKAKQFYLDNGHSLEEINNWIESLKIK